MAGLEPEGAYKMLAKARSLERAGKKILHFEIGEPDFPTPTNIKQAAIDAIEQGKTKYTPTVGIPQLREGIAKHIGSSPDQIVVTPSGKTAIFATMSALLEKGDELVYPSPSFPTYEIVGRYLGATLHPVPLLEENGFSFDMGKLRSLVNDKTKLIIISSPSNPTGGVVPVKDLIEIGELATTYDCWVMTDEIYAQLVYDEYYPSFYGLKQFRDRTILVDGFSKAYSMTGWRLGYISAPTTIVEKLDYLLTHMAASSNTPTQWAGVEALMTDVSDMRSQFKIRRDMIVKGLNDIKGVSCVEPNGAFYVFPNIKSFGKTSAEIENHLLEHGVATLQGTYFGKYGEGYIRLSYANSLKEIDEGLTKIEHALKKL